MKKRTYLISLSLAAGLALSQLTGCASSGPEETTAAESTQAPSEAETASIPIQWKKWKMSSPLSPWGSIW